MERTYTIPLRKAFLKTPRYLRSNKAVREVRLFLQRHTKTTDVKLGEELNKALWSRGDSKPPSRVTVFVKKEEDAVYAELAGIDFRKKEFAQDEEQAKSKLEQLKEKMAGKSEAKAPETPAAATQKENAETAAPAAAKPATKKAAKTSKK